MAPISGAQIADMVDAGLLELAPFDPKLVQPASYDLRLHEKVLASPLGPTELGKVHHLSEDFPVYAIQPGQMVGVMSLEVLQIPRDLTGRFGIRSDFARKGINAFGGLQLDPGWRGRLILNLLNVGPEPIPIHFHEPIFSVEFNRVEGVALSYDGPHQDQLDFSHDQQDYILSARTTSLAEIPRLRVEIDRLTNAIEDLSDRLPDPDSGLRLKQSVMDQLERSLTRPDSEFLTLEELEDRLGQ